MADNEPIDRLKITPASFLGSCRYMLPEDLGDKVYDKLFDTFAQMNIGYVFYIGGNDSMDTVSKLSRVALLKKSDIRFIGVPKTIDNDLVMTDHTPGYGSTAKYVASTLKEIILDATCYAHPSVTIVELMGRHAGWVTAASVLARTEYSRNPYLIYMPEHAFDMEELRTKTADSYVNMQMQHRLMVLDIRCLQAVESILKIMLKQNLESNAEVLSLIFHRDVHHFLLQQQILMKPKKQERQRL